jgi:cell division protein FtsQ
MARKQSAEQGPARRNWRRALRYALLSAAVLTLLAAVLFLWSRADGFLAEDERLRLVGPTGETGESPALHIEGSAYTPREKITATFAADYGRSIYLVPLAERRRNLMTIDWVKDATVSRLWPDRLAIRIVERKPVAFVQVPAQGKNAVSEVALIDSDGIILSHPERARFQLPVVTGIQREQSESMRRDRIRAVVGLLDSLEEMARPISEIDVSNPGNVKIIQPAEGHVVMLMLGDRNYPARVRNFLRHYPEILKRLPEAISFDLRLDNRITALSEEP